VSNLGGNYLDERRHSFDCLTVNNYFGCFQAVLHDLGIGVLPELT